MGWEVRDSITAENISIPGGNGKILRIEFLNGAGLDLDAVKFTKLITPVSGVSVSGCPTGDLKVGDKIILNAVVSPFDADNKEITWSSSDNAVASVDENGMLEAHSTGTATITLSSVDGGFTDECLVNVVSEIISVYGVTIGNCPGYILQAGNTHQLLANVAPANATDPTVTWHSSNPLVATVDGAGLVTGISQGTATITVTTNDGGYTNSCSLGVMSTGKQVTGVTLNGCPTGSIAVDSSFQLTAEIIPADAGNPAIAWSSSDTEVAVVDPNGLVTALSEGEAILKVTTIEGSFFDECNLKVDHSVEVQLRKRDHTSSVKVYPNPAGSKLHFDFNDREREKEIKVYNVYGQLLFSASVQGSNYVLALDGIRSNELMIIEINNGRFSEYHKIIRK